MNGFFDGEMLLTYSGATLAVTLITQFIKQTFAVRRLPIRLVSYLAAIAILLAASLAYGAGIKELPLIPLNAIVVALAANGSYDALQKN